MKADKKVITRLVKTAKGQLEGIIKMIEEDEYCIDISNQLMAAQAIIKKANNEIIRAHMKNCIKEAFDTGNGDEKVEELMNVINKIK